MGAPKTQNSLNFGSSSQSTIDSSSSKNSSQGGVKRRTNIR